MAIRDGIFDHDTVSSDSGEWHFESTGALDYDIDRCIMSAYGTQSQIGLVGEKISFLNRKISNRAHYRHLVRLGFQCDASITVELLETSPSPDSSDNEKTSRIGRIKINKNYLNFAYQIRKGLHSQAIHAIRNEIDFFTMHQAARILELPSKNDAVFLNVQFPLHLLDLSAMDKLTDAYSTISEVSYRNVKPRTKRSRRVTFS